VSTNGIVELNLANTFAESINITAIGCNENNTISNMHDPTPYNSIVLQPEQSANIYAQCYMTSALKYAGSIGGSFTGYVFVNYTNSQAKLSTSISGQLTAVISTSQSEP